MWIVVLAIWPKNSSVSQIAEEMSKLWGAKFPKTKPIFPANMTDNDIAAKWEGLVPKLMDKERENDDNKHDEESKDSDDDDDKKKKKDEGSDTDSGTDLEDRKRKQKVLEDAEEATMPKKKKLEKRALKILSRGILLSPTMRMALAIRKQSQTRSKSSQRNGRYEGSDL
jgi:hypothetical protein